MSTPLILDAVKWPRFVSESWLERLRQPPEPAPPPEVSGDIVKPAASVPDPSEASESESSRSKSDDAKTPAPRTKSAPPSAEEDTHETSAPRAEDDETQEAEHDVEQAKPPTDLTYKVDRRALSQLIKTPADLGQHGHFVPHVVDGQRRGFRFTDVAPGGLFDHLGLEKGDVVLDVNGRALTTQTKLIEDARELRRERVYVVRIKRGDAVRIHRYDAGPPLERKKAPQEKPEQASGNGPTQ